VSDLRYLDALNSAEKNQKKNKTLEKIMRSPPAKPLYGPG
jgi:hypothetical protein